MVQSALVELIGNRTRDIHTGSILRLTTHYDVRDAQPLTRSIAGIPGIDTNLQLVAIFQIDNRRYVHLVHHTAGHRARRVDGGTGDEAVGRVVYVTAQATTTLCANLHSDVVDVELLTIRRRHRKLYILVGGVILSLYPGAAVAGADH